MQIGFNPTLRNLGIPPKLTKIQIGFQKKEEPTSGRRQTEREQKKEVSRDYYNYLQNGEITDTSGVADFINRHKKK